MFHLAGQQRPALQVGEHPPLVLPLRASLEPSSVLPGLLLAQGGVARGAEWLKAAVLKTVRC
ncbi:MAG: hypothetical protein HY690_01300 [Chloroflexi bacterium]|nr:hypothetical protein [Chloroflexota bacterium]